MTKGHKLKLSMILGRMITHIDVGRQVMNNFIEELKEYGTKKKIQKWTGACSNIITR